MATANVIATKCPPIQVSTTIYNPNGASPTPPSGPSLTAGAIAIVAAFNRLSLRADMAVMHGCGACGIGEGLDVTTAGLTATVSAGIGISLGELSLPTGGTIALTPNTYNWVYLTKAGVISLVTAGSDTPPALPVESIFLRRLQTDGAGALSNDYSGVPYFKGPYLIRFTGDAYAPLDTPSARLGIVTVTAGGLFLWDGTTHNPLSSAFPLYDTLIALGVTRDIPLGKAFTGVGPIDIDGTLQIEGAFHILA